jgi:hypothetical protein
MQFKTLIEGLTEPFKSLNPKRLTQKKADVIVKFWFGANLPFSAELIKGSTGYRG